MKYLNQTVLSAVDTASINSAAIDTSQIVSISFHSLFGDITAAGSVKIQASNDLPPSNNLPPAFVPTNWVDVPSATATIVDGAPALITIAQTTYRWLRVVFTRTGGGSTTIKVNLFAVCL